jgi:uncharacterized protein HemX
MRAAINSAKGDLDILAVSTQDLIDAANSVRGHFDLMQEEVVVEQPALDALLKSMISKTVYEELESYEVLNTDPTDYSYISNKIHEITDQVVEARLNGASLVNDNGDTKFNIETN